MARKGPSENSAVLRCCTHLGTGQVSTFHHMPAIMQWDKDIKLLVNHKHLCNWSLLAAFLRFDSVSGQTRAEKKLHTNTVSNYKEMSHRSGALASVCSPVAGAFWCNCSSWRHAYCTYHNRSVPKITLKVTGKNEDTWPLANKVSMRVKSTCLQLRRDGTVNHCSWTVTTGVNNENILRAVQSLWSGRFWDWEWIA